MITFCHTGALFSLRHFFLSVHDAQQCDVICRRITGRHWNDASQTVRALVRNCNQICSISMLWLGWNDLGQFLRGLLRQTRRFQFVVLNLKKKLSINWQVCCSEIDKLVTGWYRERRIAKNEQCQDFRHYTSTVNIRKRNVRFDKPNKILFGLKLFSLFSSVCSFFVWFKTSLA